MNSRRGASRATSRRVLIDTWWNVNGDIVVALEDDRIVLIDTWWNVNKFTIFIFCTTDPRFNRYMVECEL